MAENKTKPTSIDPAKYIANIGNDVRRADATILLDIFATITGEPAKMWGPSIIGYGSYHYKYASGHEGDSFVAGFAPRKRELVIYLVGNCDGQSELLTKLGKHKTGRACLYIKKLEIIDMSILKKLIAESTDAIRAKYPS